MQTRQPEARRGESGFALVLAILSLMLLTFLGLTLATTTSTELQIATNHRWSQMALYNAEAGLEAAKIVLSNSADVSIGWQPLLPLTRAGQWYEGAAPGPSSSDLASATGRDFYNQSCDTRGGIGYGRVLNDGTQRYEDVSDFGGQTLNGAFTVWIRRPLVTDNSGQFSDSTATDALIIVSEGRAPYTGSDQGTSAGEAFIRARQATRVLETRFALVLDTVGDPCYGSLAGQEGLSPTGENVNPCAAVTEGATGSLGNVFGGAEAGDLTRTGAE
jgi:hypothetical protein